MLTPGTRIGPYEILSPIGAGGMGQVYRARDPRLGRDVAIKVLAGVAIDADHLKRFEQEARAAAALNHPNILAVYDVGTHEGTPYVVSELLDGQTLREQLSSGPLSVRKALEYAVQIARGLEAAHEKGIVHRDLKPDNVLITTSGRVKIVDFGLAKLAEGPISGPLADQTTHTSITVPGTILGTVGYMAPEQIRGLPTDHRADLFAFGAILHEMVSGHRAFRGDTAADTMSAILKEPPLPVPADRHIPPALERIIDRCLEKAPAARFQSAGDLAFALEGMSSSSAETLSAAPSAASPRPAVAWTLAGIFAALAAASGVIAFRQPRAIEPSTYRASVLPPDHATLFNTTSPAGGLALSPDGRRLVFAATGQEGRVQLWLRALDNLTATPLAGTEGAFYPFWSPDSESIAFFAGNKIKRMDIAGGGSPVTLCDTPRPSVLAAGGTWNRDGVILFALATLPIYRVSAAGGTATPATTLDQQTAEAQHWAPFFLPDGHHFLYLAVGTKAGGPDDPNGVFVGTLDGRERTLLFSGGSNAKYAQGYLIFPRERVLLAQPFDVARRELRGEAVPIADQLSVGGLSGRTGAFSVSDTGVLAYQAGFGEVHSQLTWFDRAGKSLGTVGGPADYGNLEMSPDREQAAVSVLDPAKRTRDIWIVDMARDVRTRFSVEPGDEQSSVWASDGKHLLFNSRTKGYFDLYEQDPTGLTGETVLLSDPRNKTPNSWSPDGRYLLYSSAALAVGNSDIWLLTMPGAARSSPPGPAQPTSAPFLQTPFSETNARFSPDGRWVAYVSDESGSNDVYVTRFPGPSGKWPISSGGGSYPRWRGDGREIFFLSRDNHVMAATFNGQGAEADVGAPRALFEVHPRAGQRYPYDVSADGQRFVVNTLVEATALPPITLVVNWAASIRTP